MAPMASKRSASCTQWSSRHVWCQAVRPPVSRNLDSVDHEILSIILQIRSARPSAWMSSSAFCWETVSKNGAKSSRVDLDSPKEYFLSFISWNRADTSTTKTSIWEEFWLDCKRSARWRAVFLTRFTERKVFIFYYYFFGKPETSYHVMRHATDRICSLLVPSSLERGE